jgi:hypothetical protein
MSAEHKAALAEGRAQGRAVRQYLEALEAHRPKRGRKRTTDSINKRLAQIDTELETAVAVKRLHLVQEKIDLETELGASDHAVDITELEAAFVAAAAEYSARKGISYSAWRQLGVPASTLRDAGIGRGS